RLSRRPRAPPRATAGIEHRLRSASARPPHPRKTSRGWGPGGASPARPAPRPAVQLLTPITVCPEPRGTEKQFTGRPCGPGYTRKPFSENRSMLQQGNDPAPLSKTIASTATIKLAHPPMLDLFYTPLEERFERITRIARQALKVPVAAITLLNAEKQWFKSASGWAIAELPADVSLCRLTLEQNGLQVIPDTKSDPRTAQHPLVVSKPKFRFYAGHPLADGSGLVAGTFCVFDVKPRHLSEAERKCMQDLAALA